MDNGYYTDVLTGNKFTVENGKINGTVGTYGVAVLYNEVIKPLTTPQATLSLNGEEVTADTLLHFSGDTAAVPVNFNTAESGSYSIDGGETIKINSGEQIVIGGNILLTSPAFAIVFVLSFTDIVGLGALKAIDT